MTTYTINYISIVPYFHSYIYMKRSLNNNGKLTYVMCYPILLQLNEFCFICRLLSSEYLSIILHFESPILVKLFKHSLQLHLQ